MNIWSNIQDLFSVGVTHCLITNLVTPTARIIATFHVHSAEEDSKCHGKHTVPGTQVEPLTCMPAR